MGNISHGSIGSMNISQGGYGSDASQKSGATKQGSGTQGQPESILQDAGPSRVSNSAGGIEDLKNWLKFESNKKYEESLVKLGLDTSKIQGKHLVAYSLDELQNEKKRVKNELKVYD